MTICLSVCLPVYLSIYLYIIFFPFHQATLELQAKIEAVRGLNDVTRLQFDKILAPSTVCPRKSAASSSSTSSDCNGPISGALGLLASCYDEDEDETER